MVKHSASLGKPSTEDAALMVHGPHMDISSPQNRPGKLVVILEEGRRGSVMGLVVLVVSQVLP